MLCHAKIIGYEDGVWQVAAAQSGARITQVVQQLLKLSLKDGHVLSRRFPGKLKVYTEIAMDEDIPHILAISRHGMSG